MFRVVMASVLALFMTVPAMADGGPVPDEVPPEDTAGDPVPSEPDRSYTPYEEESNSGYYAAVQAGAVFLEDDPGDLFDTGFGILGSAGYAFNSGIRAEIEVGYRNLSAELPGFEEDDDIIAVFANILYEYPHGPVRPYAGGGVGITNVSAEGQVLGVPFDISDTAFAWQLIGGAAIPVTDNIALVADYRYASSEGLEEGGIDLDNSTHNIMGGVRIGF